MKHSKFILGFFLGALLFGLIGWLLPIYVRAGFASESSIRLGNQYKLISPLLLCGTSEPKDFGEYKPLETSIKNVINSVLASGKATDISVYFRDFQGKWVGVNENEKYAPASLLKVPLMIAYFKKAESNPSVLKQTITYDGSFDDNKNEVFKSPYDIVPGVYTINNLLKAMIVNSDNNATLLLDSFIDKDYLSEVYTDLGLSVPTTDIPTASNMSPKEYSYFFRILYNATYLSPAYSEQALELLSGHDFPQGIRFSIPSDITVAQKFGERTVLSSTGQVETRELHDCGIVYNHDKLYFLCIMTKGADFKNLTSVIQSITKVVQSEVSGR